MDSVQRKGINFDLDTAALKRYYPGGDWHNAYNDVRQYFENHDFEHIQGSGYHSVKAMSEAKAMAVIYQMTKQFPWLNYCVAVCTIADVPVLYDITHVFEREAARLEEKNQ
ncbi:MAG: hypothetical protein LUH53_00680 [Lachnospiraceae bacterium]|nr:hypothetical protein [Lachnospiraceae bacterium]